MLSCGAVYHENAVIFVMSQAWDKEAKSDGNRTRDLLYFLLNKVFLTFDSVDEILKCDHSNESY